MRAYRSRYAVPARCAAPESPANGGNHLFLCINHHIHDKRKLRRLRRIQHVPVNRIAVQNAGPRLRVHNELGTVIRQNRPAGSDSGKHAFAAAGKAGKKMRFDKTFGNQQVRFRRQPADDQVSAGRQFSQMHQLRIVSGVMHRNFLTFHNLRAELFNQLRLRRRTVETGRNQNRNINAGIPPAQPFQNLRHDDPARNGARVIAADDNGIFRFGSQFLKRRGTNGSIQCAPHFGGFVNGCRRQGRMKTPEKIFLIDPCRKYSLSVRYFDVRHIATPSCKRYDDPHYTTPAE